MILKQIQNQHLSKVLLNILINEENSKILSQQVQNREPHIYSR